MLDTSEITTSDIKDIFVLPVLAAANISFWLYCTRFITLKYKSISVISEFYLWDWGNSPESKKENIKKVSNKWRQKLLMKPLKDKNSKSPIW